MSTKYVYLIKSKIRFEDGSSEGFEVILRSYSSLKKAIDYLEFWKEIYEAEFRNAGYDLESDVKHWVDLRLEGAYSFLNRCNGSEIKTMSIDRIPLF